MKFSLNDKINVVKMLHIKVLSNLPCFQCYKIYLKYDNDGGGGDDDDEDDNDDDAMKAKCYDEVFSCRHN